MTNLEWLIKEHKDEFKDTFIYSSCWGVDNKGIYHASCAGLPCYNCKFGGGNCVEVKKAWLNAEHEDPLLFPIGTPVEVHDGDIWLAFYNGTYKGLHYVTRYKANINATQSDGKTPCGTIRASHVLKKAGD